MSGLIIPERFGDEVISAEKLQANFDKCADALNTINRENFDTRSITNECLIAHTVSSVITFEPSLGRDVSWTGLKRLGWVTYSDWEVYKMAVWCSANAGSATIQLVTTGPTYSSTVTDLTRVGPTMAPRDDKVLYSDVYGLTLKKYQALWYEHLLSDGTSGSSTDLTQGDIEGLRISLYFRTPLRRP